MLMTVAAFVLGYFAVNPTYYAAGSASKETIDDCDLIMMFASIIVFVVYHLFFYFRSVGRYYRRVRMEAALNLVRQSHRTTQRYPAFVRQVGAGLAQYGTELGEGMLGATSGLLLALTSPVQRGASATSKRFNRVGPKPASK